MRIVFACTDHKTTREKPMDSSKISAVTWALIKPYWKQREIFDGPISLVSQENSFHRTVWRSAVMPESEYQEWIKGKKVAAAEEESRILALSMEMEDGTGSSRGTR